MVDTGTGGGRDVLREPGNKPRWQEWQDWTSRQPPPAARGGLAWQGPARGRRKYAVRTPSQPGGGLRQFELYQTSRWIYLVGRTIDGSRARLMRVDREQGERFERRQREQAYGPGGLPASDGLHVELDPPEYDSFLAEKMEVRSTVETASAFIRERVASTEKHLQRTDIRGLMGAVRFTEGYYLVIAKEAEHVADLGCHEMYRVEEMELIPVSTKVASWTLRTNPETRYKERFHSAQVEKDCYFSYSYDITHALQFNVCDVAEPAKGARLWIPQTMFLWNEYLLSGLVSVIPRGGVRGDISSVPQRAKADERVQHWINTEMVIAVMNGHIAQKRLYLVGRVITLTLIARRSRHFAGTRYLKRGINNRGHVANEVETEQIVHEEATRVHPIGQHFTSFVQVRGSVPLFWSQKARYQDPRPIIDIQKQLDPSYHATMLHFADLIKRYGYPVVCLNLIKKPNVNEEDGLDQLEQGSQEPSHREVKLGREYRSAFNHHYGSLPAGIVGTPLMEYLHWDLRKTTRGQTQSDEQTESISENKESMILKELEFLEPHVEKLGIFDSNDVRLSLSCRDDGAQAVRSERQLQRGVVRSNCIDGLDRTNTAQFHMGLYALGHQLHALGVIGLDNNGRPMLNLEDSGDKNITIVLAVMFEEMGNKLAMQYGGSEAHQFMVAKLSGQSAVASSFKDAFKSVHRYISNTFTDVEKQQAINLFLGKFQQSCAIGPTGAGSDVDETGFPFHLWDLENDFHLHNLSEDWPTPSKDNPLYAGTRSYYEMEIDHKTQVKTKESVQSGRWIQAALDEYNRRVGAVEGNWSTVFTDEPVSHMLGEEQTEQRCVNVPSRFGVLPKTVIEQQYRPVMTTFTNYDDSAASVHEAILLPPRSTSPDKCSSCRTAWSIHDGAELDSLVRPHEGDKLPASSSRRVDDGTEESESVPMPREVKARLGIELPKIRDYLARTAHGEAVTSQVPIDCVKLDSFLRTSNHVRKSPPEPAEVPPASSSVKFADEAGQAPRLDDFEERAQKEDDTLRSDALKYQKDAQAWVDHTCDDAEKAIFAQFSQFSGGIDSRWAQKNFDPSELEVRKNEMIAIQALLHHAKRDILDYKLLELYLDDAVRGIEHLLDPDRRAFLNLAPLGQHDAWDALGRNYGSNSPIEHRELASSAAPGASEPRIHLLAWVAYRASFPDVHAVLRRFRLDGKRDLTGFAEALRTLGVGTAKQMEELTDPSLARADPCLPAADREKFLAIVKSAAFADFVCGEVGPICSHLRTNAELASDARVCEAEYRRRADELESESSAAQSFFSSLELALAIQWPASGMNG